MVANFTLHSCQGSGHTHEGGVALVCHIPLFKALSQAFAESGEDASAGMATRPLWHVPV